ncbi:hypothetical protein E2562_020022 [Oryza meyeriana var. granulata]|uniref:Uncharacterized protein n=1 Tax=Oryza meyeriana var. granulata TaxID=110450 RepID=A0A6G1FAK8_9ORYZ|nr:hypothetical protein E2562_020022 [Oryza meyeriana var. granulata]
MKKIGKMPAKVKKITFTGSQTECQISLADSQADSQAPSSTDLATGPSTQAPTRDAPKPPITKKTCRKRKVDSDDGDESATKKLKSLNRTSLKAVIDACAALSPTHVRMLTDLHFDGILRMTLEGLEQRDLVSWLLKPIEGTCYYHDDFDKEIEPRGGNHGNPWPKELIRR